MIKNFTFKVPISGRVLACLKLLNKFNVNNKTILDVGSSFGWLEREILKTGKSNKLIGVDPNKDAVMFAQKKVKGARFLVGDALNLPLKNNQVDMVTLFDVIEHVPENFETKALNEVNRVLMKGGLLFLSTPNSKFLLNILDVAYLFGHRHYKKEQLIKYLKKSKFKIIESRILGGYWFSIYLIWLYLTKRITGNFLPRNTFLENREASEFLKDNGIHTHFIVARKM